MTGKKLHQLQLVMIQFAKLVCFFFKFSNQLFVSTVISITISAISIFNNIVLCFSHKLEKSFGPVAKLFFYLGASCTISGWGLSDPRLDDPEVFIYFHYRVLN